MPCNKANELLESSTLCSNSSSYQGLLLVQNDKETQITVTLKLWACAMSAGRKTFQRKIQSKIIATTRVPRLTTRVLNDKNIRICNGPVYREFDREIEELRCGSGKIWTRKGKTLFFTNFSYFLPISIVREIFYRDTTGTQREKTRICMGLT